MPIKARNIIVNGRALPQEEKPIDMKLEDGTVMHNGRQKKFNKKMSAYMIDMLTSED